MLELTQKAKNRLTAISIIIYFFSGLMFIRLFSLQIIHSKEYKHLAENNKTQIIRIPAYRSIIYDCTLKSKLAYNRKSISVSIIPANLPEKKDEKERVLSNLSELINIPVDKIKETLKLQALDKYSPIVIKYDIEPRTLVRLAEHNNLYPGVLWGNRPRRVYPSREKASQVIGYTGIINKRELKKYQHNPEYHSGSVLGKMGIEQYYDNVIRGKEGIKERTVDARGTVLSETNVREPRPGDPLVLSINRELQEYAYSLLNERRGAIVVSKASTGEILALVSSPGFDPNVFTDRFSEEDFFVLKNNQNKPFLNRAIQGTYPPGSTFKLVSSSAILDAGISPTKTLTCKGYIQIGRRRFNDWAVHGRGINLFKAIAESCDVYFYTMGISPAVGREHIMKLARLYGINQKTGIDIPNERAGLIPEIDWFKKHHHRPWSLGDTANISIGQGDILITPLELNVLTAAIVNNGIIYRPFILKEKLDIQTRKVIWKKQPEILRKINMPVSSFEAIRRGMHDVTQYGTAKWIHYLTDVPLAGKTGTAQAGKNKKDHSLFTAYAPYNAKNIDDVIVVSVIIENAGHGAEHAAPVAAKIIDYYFKKIHPMNFKKKKSSTGGK